MKLVASSDEAQRVDVVNVGPRSGLCMDAGPEWREIFILERKAELGGGGAVVLV